MLTTATSLQFATSFEDLTLKSAPKAKPQTRTTVPRDETAQLDLIATAFVKRYGSPTRIIVLLIFILLNLARVIKRRLFYGPRRENWSWAHEIIVETMQYNYKYHLERAVNEPIPYDVVIDGFMEFDDEYREIQRNKLLVRLNITEEGLRSYCCAQFFQSLIGNLPPIPYSHFANASRETLKKESILKMARQYLLNENNVHDVTVDLVSSFNTKPEEVEKAVIFSHGGGYNLRIEISWQMMVMKMANDIPNSLIVIPHYRLAPKHPFPGAIDDLMATYVWLMTPKAEGGMGFRGDQIVVVGESAGGGALVSLCLRLRECMLPKPSCAVLMSPWIDLTCSDKEFTDHCGITSKSNSWQDNYESDILHPPVYPFDLSTNFVHGVHSSRRIIDARNPIVSPFFASKELLRESLPPVLIQLGQKECLVNEGVWLANQLDDSHYELVSKHTIGHEEKFSQNNTCYCEVYEDMTHVFQIFFSFKYAPSTKAIERFCYFINNNV